MTSAFGNLITLLIVAIFSTIGFEPVNKIQKFKVKSQKHPYSCQDDPLVQPLVLIFI